MDGLTNNLGIILGNNPVATYLSIFVAGIFLGNLADFTALWLAFRGYLGNLGVLPVIFVICISDITADLLWYSLGSLLVDTKFSDKLKKYLPFIPRLEARFQENSFRWIFLSKFIWLSAFPVLFYSGWARVPIQKVARPAILGILSWLPILTILAYSLFSGLSLVGAEGNFHRLEILFVCGLLGFLFLDFVLGWLVRKLANRR